MNHQVEECPAPKCKDVLICEESGEEKMFNMHNPRQDDEDHYGEKDILTVVSP